MRGVPPSRARAFVDHGGPSDLADWRQELDRQLASTGGTDGADTLTSGVRSDVLNGLGGNDVLLGKGGDDTLDGGTGTDTMSGGAGNDTFVVDMSGDVLIERADGGIDTAFVSAQYYVLAANVENLDGSSLGFGTNFLVGNDLDNVITGSSHYDHLMGGAGTDTLRGGLGDDFYRLETAGDLVIEARDAGVDMVMTDLARYRMPANVEEFIASGTAGQMVFGNALGNEIYSGQGADTVRGGQGDDTLFGTTGRDVLTGGGGADWFEFFGAYGEDNAARIVDFRVAEGDQIVLRKSTSGQFSSFALGHLDPSEFKQYDSRDEIDATDRILYDITTGKLFFDPDGSGSAWAMQFARLSNDAPLTEDCFWVIT
jgi:Ca2+-binding RTX toxin-like protein